jgi:hypothetical protein
MRDLFGVDYVSELMEVRSNSRVNFWQSTRVELALTLNSLTYESSVNRMTKRTSKLGNLFASSL